MKKFNRLPLHIDQFTLNYSWIGVSKLFSLFCEIKGAIYDLFCTNTPLDTNNFTLYGTEARKFNCSRQHINKMRGKAVYDVSNKRLSELNLYKF